MMRGVNASFVTLFGAFDSALNQHAEEEPDVWLQHEILSVRCSETPSKKRESPESREERREKEKLSWAVMEETMP